MKKCVCRSGIKIRQNKIIKLSSIKKIKKTKKTRDLFRARFSRINKLKKLVISNKIIKMKKVT